MSPVHEQPSPGPPRSLHRPPARSAGQWEQSAVRQMEAENVQDRLRAKRIARRQGRAVRVLWLVVGAIALAAVLVGLAVLASGCASNEAAREALVRVAGCCATSTAPQCATAEEDLHTLGVGLSHGSAADTLAAIWAVFSPITENVIHSIMNTLSR